MTYDGPVIHSFSIAPQHVCADLGYLAVPPDMATLRFDVHAEEADLEWGSGYGLGYPRPSMGTNPTDYDFTHTEPIGPFSLGVHNYTLTARKGAASHDRTALQTVTAYDNGDSINIGTLNSHCISPVGPWETTFTVSPDEYSSQLQLTGAVVTLSQVPYSVSHNGSPFVVRADGSQIAPLSGPITGSWTVRRELTSSESCDLPGPALGVAAYVHCHP